jgi:cellulose synthase operon protein C
MCIRFPNKLLFAKIFLIVVFATVEIMALANPQQRIAAGELFLANGDAPLAEGAFRGALTLSAQLTNEERQQASFGLIFSLIAESNPDAAADALKNLGQTNHPRAQLAELLICVEKNDFVKASELLEKCPVDQFKGTDLYARYLAEGVLMESTGKFQAAKEAFLHAMVLAPNLTARNQANRHLVWLSCLDGKMAIDADLLKYAKRDWKRAKRPDLSTAAALQYAAILRLSGQTQEAILVLNDQLSALGKSDKKEQIKLWGALMDLCARGSQEQVEAALHLLELSESGVQLSSALIVLEKDLLLKNPSRLRDIVTRSIEAPQPCAILPELLLTRARTYLQENSLEQAMQDAKRVQSSFPGTRSYTQACSLIAWIALNRTPPQYRTAAQALSEAIKGDIESEVRWKWMLWEGDLYAVSGDAGLASALYKALFENKEAPASARSKAVCRFFQMNAELEEVTVMASFLDDSSLVSLLEPKDFLTAGLIYLRALARSGKTSEAIAQIDKLRPLYSVNEFAELEALLLTLLASNQDWSALKIRSQALEAQLSQMDRSSISNQAWVNLMSIALFEKAHAELEENELTAANLTLNRLRKEFPHASLAALSYIIEADYYAGLDRLVEAQQRLVELADTHGDSPYAPIAIMQAARYARKRRFPAAYEDSIGLLDRIVRQYPQDADLVFEARFEQAQILEILGRFDDAQSLFDALLYQYAKHPEVPRLLLAKGDCLFAQATQSSNIADKAQQAGSLFERLFDQTTLAPALRVEAGYKWAKTLEAQGKPGQAIEVYTRIITELLLITPEGVIQWPAEGTRYWLSRSILDEAKLLEAQGGKDAQIQNLYSLLVRYDLQGQLLMHNSMLSNNP